MKLRNLVAATAATAALAGLAGCDRPGEPDRMSKAPGTTAPQSAPTAQATPQAAPGAPAGDRTAGQTVDDAGVTAKVKAALVAEKGVNGMSINVDTVGGRVTLTGRVPDQSQVERATQVATAIEGVKAVDNRLTVGAS